MSATSRTSGTAATAGRVPAGVQRLEAGGSAATATTAPVLWNRLRLAGWFLLAAHLLLVGWLTLRPLDVPWAAAANLTPLEGIKADLAWGPLGAARRIGGGLALLAPLGVLLPLAGGLLASSSSAASSSAAWSSLARTAAAAVLFSVSIEMLQSAIPGRVVDVDSVLLSTVGVVLAHVAVVPALRARLRRSRRLPQGPTPRITRVGVGPWTEVLSAVPREY